MAPVTGFVALTTFADGMIIDDDTTQDQGGSGQPIQIMEEYGCGYSSTNDVVGFEDVDFGANGADAVTVRFGYGNDNNTVTTLDVMIDDPASAAVAKLNVGYTGAWTIDGSGYITVPVEIPAGVHSVYFKFTNELSGSLSEAYFAEAEPAAVEEVVDGGSAPATFDAAVVAAVAAIISAAGYAVSKKR